MRLESHLHPGLDEHPLVATSPADADVLLHQLAVLGGPRVAYLRDDDEMIAALLAVDEEQDMGVLLMENPEPAYPAEEPGVRGHVTYRDAHDAVPLRAAWQRPLDQIRAALRELLGGQTLPPAIAWRDGAGEAL